MSCAKAVSVPPLDPNGRSETASVPLHHEHGKTASNPLHCAAVREAAVREAAVREEAVREAAVREAAVREAAVREAAVREAAVREAAVSVASKSS